MHILDLKLLRDLGRMKAQVVAIALVVATGVSLFIGMSISYQSLHKSGEASYAGQRFAHVWSELSRAPMSVKTEIAALPDVTAVEARLVSPTVLDMPGIVEPATALVISIPAWPGHAVNDIQVTSGRHVERAAEVLINEHFSERNHLHPGDSLNALIAGQRIGLRIVGVARSPEFVMPVAPGAFVYDQRRFAILWMDHAALEAALDMRGAFNDVALRLAPGADERAAIERLDRLLEPYGGRGAFGRASQGSHVMVEGHVQGIKALALMVPAIFFLVAAFLVNIVLARFVATQRAQIGMLKAFGYSNFQVAIHYLKLALVVVLLGVALAFPIGAWMGGYLSDYYATFFRFPVRDFTQEPTVFAQAVMIAVVTAALSVMGTIRRVAAMPPIVAMTPEVPAFRRTVLDRLGITPLLSVVTRMIVRNLTKRPLRTALASAGMSLAIGVVVLGSASGAGTERIKDVQFQAARRDDVSITFARPRNLGAMHDVRALPGVTRAEPFRAVPARLLAGGRHEDITLLGLTQGAVLRRVVDSDYRRVPSLGSGVVITAWTARRLGLAPGDSLAVEIRERQRHVVTVNLAAVVDEPLFQNAYMDLSALGRLLGEPDTFTGANLTLDPLRERQFYDIVKGLPNVTDVSYRKSSLQSYAKMSDDAVNIIRYIELFFAIIIAFGVVYNTARIMLAERGTELATLRVLGFTRGEVSAVLFGEIAILALPAIPLGFIAGRAMTALVIRSMSSGSAGRFLHIPLLVSPAMYAFALVVFAIAALGSALVVRRRIDRLDLVAVLKERE